MKYRAEIDGLRALAVLPVILFHAGFDWFSGGFIGVDVFFVISGYLITTIIVSELAGGKFSILDFYERRARRILPALFSVMLVCLPFAWFWLGPDGLKNFGQSLVAVSTFSANIFFWLEHGYFTSAAELKPLIHTWSLSVEEQYYILFPIILVGIWRYCAGWWAALLLFAFAASLGFSEWGAYHRSDLAFYSLPTRAWELLLGAIVALHLRQNNFPKNTSLTQSMSLLGLMLIVGSMFWIDRKTPFPGLYALAPTLGTALLIVFTRPGTWVFGLLALRPIAGAGLVSYSAYLWHQPMLAFAHHRFVGELSTFTMLVICFMSFPVGYLSWRLIEKPFRNRKQVSTKALVTLAIVFAAIFIAIGMMLHLGKGYTSRFYDEEQHGKLTSEQRSSCHFGDKNYSADPCIYFSDKASWATFGDSHSVEVSVALAEALREKGQGVLHHTFSGCIPALRARPGFACSVWSEKTIRAIAENSSIENVVVSYRLSSYVNGEHLEEGNRMNFVREREGVWQNLQGILQVFSEAEKRVYLILQTPELSTDIFKLLRYREVRVNGHLVGVPREEWNQRMAFVYDRIGDIPDTVTVFDPADIFCDDRFCYASNQEKLRYFDSHHPSIFGATEIIAEMNRRFNMFESPGENPGSGE